LQSAWTNEVNGLDSINEERRVELGAMRTGGNAAGERRPGVSARRIQLQARGLCVEKR